MPDFIAMRHEKHPRHDTQPCDTSAMIGRSGKAPAALSGILRLTGTVFLASLIALAALMPVAWAEPVWQFVEADSDWPDIPHRTIEETALLLNHGQVNTLRTGQSFILPVTPDKSISARVTEITQTVNGDRVMHAVSEDQVYALVLTAGRDALFGYLDNGSEVWQFHARKAAADSRYPGWLYRAAGLQHGSEIHSDYVVPERHRDYRPHRVSRPDSGVSEPGPHIMPLTVGQQAVDAPTASAVNEQNFRITQRFSRQSIVLGEQAELSLEITFDNLGSDLRRDLFVDIHFLLEDMHVLQIPGACRRIDWVLRCHLGSIAAESSSSLNFVVRAGPVEQPERLWSTVVAGSMQNNAFVSVVQDVVHDSEGAGISDFNRALLETTQLDSRGQVIIDVMALYTPEARALYGRHAETRINQLISVANQIYRDSGVGITLRPVYHGEVAYPAAEGAGMHTVLEHLTYASHDAFSQVPALRERYGADLVMLFQPLGENAGLCGLANLGGHNSGGDFTSFHDRDFAYSLIAIDCPISSVVAHELGHNMGLTHSRLEDGAGGTFDYATGHGIPGEFVTVMAHPQHFHDAERVLRFSNPELDCKGQPCGVDHADPEHGADAVRTLNLVRFQIANYFPTRVPLSPGHRVTSADGSPTQTRIGMSASADGGLTQSRSLRVGDSIDISADFAVDPAHIGRNAFFHMVVEIGGQIVQVDKYGNLHLWDGENLNALLPFTDTAPLRATEYLQLVEAFRPEAQHAGDIVVYVAYQLADSDEMTLVYTLEPLILSVEPAE